MNPSSLSNEETFASVPEVAILIYMVETELLFGVCDKVGEDMI